MLPRDDISLPGSCVTGTNERLYHDLQRPPARYTRRAPLRRRDRIMRDDIQFMRLSEIAPDDIIALMNDADVRRHLPLARGRFGPAECERFVQSKERMWTERGFGPWAFVRDGEFIGWGGLQPEGDDADVGLVLRPQWWGVGRQLYERIVLHAFQELGLDSVIAMLPPTRPRGGGLQRLGFEPDGEAWLSGERFVRFRLHRKTIAG